MIVKHPQIKLIQGFMEERVMPVPADPINKGLIP
jgi:hypothetical protein